MNFEAHVQTAQGFLEAADREFDAGDHLQASEKLWGAASHAVLAVARRHSWSYGSHRALEMSADKSGELYEDSTLSDEFGLAKKFHANFYHDFVEDYQLDADRPKIGDSVHSAIALLPENGTSPE